MMAISVQEGIEKLRQASRVFKQVAASPIPRELGAQETQTANQFSSWLQKAAGEMDDMADFLEKTKEMQEMNQEFNEQYLHLQENMQQESRQFTFLSNVMKTRNDTIKSVINNVR